MRDKIKPLDVSILSSYMGRTLTGVIAVFVIGVAVSALFSDGGGAQRNIVNICVSAQRTWADPMQVYEPLRRLLSSQTRRPAVLVASQEGWPEGYDLYVMPVDDFLRHSERLGVEALFELKRFDHSRDAAILIAKSPQQAPDYSALSAGDVAFLTPYSVNGFWVQMSMLSDLGFAPPESAAQLRFEGARDDATRVILGVLHGAYRVGACKLTDLTALIERDLVGGDEIQVLQRSDALPEVLVASSPAEAEYYRRKLKRIQVLLEQATTPATQRETIQLLKASGIRRLDPVRADRMREVRSLFERHSLDRFETGRRVKP